MPRVKLSVRVKYSAEEQALINRALLGKMTPEDVQAGRMVVMSTNDATAKAAEVLSGSLPWVMHRSWVP